MGCAGYCNASGGLYVYWCLWCVGYCNASGGLYVYWCLWDMQDIAMHQVVYMYIGVYGVCRIV